MKPEQKEYQMMEWHNGEFIPVKETLPDGKKGKVRTVRITSETAYNMNFDFSKKRNQGSKVKYILKSEANSSSKEEKEAPESDEEVLKEARSRYIEAFGKKPYYAWSAEQLDEKIKELNS